VLLVWAAPVQAEGDLVNDALRLRLRGGGRRSGRIGGGDLAGPTRALGGPVRARDVPAVPHRRVAAVDGERRLRGSRRGRADRGGRLSGEVGSAALYTRRLEWARGRLLRRGGGDAAADLSGAARGVRPHPAGSRTRGGRRR